MIVDNKLIINNNINNLSVKITSDELNNLSKKKIKNDDKKIYINKYLKKIESQSPDSKIRNSKDLYNNSKDF